MNIMQRNEIMQRRCIVQEELMPELRAELRALTLKILQVVHMVKWVRIEEFLSVHWVGCGRPEYDRGMLASAFVAKAVLGIIEDRWADRTFSIGSRLEAHLWFFSVALIAKRSDFLTRLCRICRGWIGGTQPCWPGCKCLVYSLRLVGLRSVMIIPILNRYLEH